MIRLLTWWLASISRSLLLGTVPLKVLILLQLLLLLQSRGSAASQDLLQPEALDKLVNHSTVLAFGDSLTSGYYLIEGYAGHVRFKPYSLKLSDLLNERVPVNVRNEGVSGETAKSMVKRLPKVLQNMWEVSHIAPRFVVILAGANDMAFTKNANAILEQVVTLHRIVRRHAHVTRQRIYTIAVAIPQAGLAHGFRVGSQGREELRLRINRGLQQFAQLSENMVWMEYLDFVESVDQTVPHNAHLWSSDWLHLSPGGYELLGRDVYSAMMRFANRLQM